MRTRPLTLRDLGSSYRFGKWSSLVRKRGRLQGMIRNEQSSRTTWDMLLETSYGPSSL